MSTGSTVRENITPLRAIRRHCLDCCAGSRNEVKLCACPDCHLYPYRLGDLPGWESARENRSGEKNPARQKKGDNPPRGKGGRFAGRTAAGSRGRAAGAAGGGGVFRPRHF